MLNITGEILPVLKSKRYLTSDRHVSFHLTCLTAKYSIFTLHKTVELPNFIF